MIKYLRKLLAFLAIAIPAAAAPGPIGSHNWSAETLGVVTHVNLTGPARWGAAVDLGRAVNPWVSLHARAIAYEDFRGPTLDEGALLAKAYLLANSKQTVCLSLAGGVNYSFERWDVGLSAAPRLEFGITKQLSLGIESGPVFWAKESRDWRHFFGFRYEF